MQISLKWLKYRLKIIISSFKYYFHTVTMVSKLKKIDLEMLPHLKSNDLHMGRLQIFSTMHKKMQISLKWLKYRLKILKSSFIYYFFIVPAVPKLKKLKKSPYDQNNRNWMSHWHHANYHIFCNFHWKFGTQPLKPFISIST